MLVNLIGLAVCFTVAAGGVLALVVAWKIFRD